MQNYLKNFQELNLDIQRGYLDAFANIYKEFAESLRTKAKKRWFFPNEYEGLETAKFIEACKISNKRKAWTKIK